MSFGAQYQDGNIPMCDDTAINPGDDLAELGRDLDDDGQLWTVALRHLVDRTADHDDPPTDSLVIESTAAQVFQEVPEGAGTWEARQFVEAFVDAYDLETVVDVKTLSRAHEEQLENYKLAVFAAAFN